jgi:hypothetical protein
MCRSINVQVHLGALGLDSLAWWPAVLFLTPGARVKTAGAGPAGEEKYCISPREVLAEATAAKCLSTAALAGLWTGWLSATCQPSMSLNSGMVLGLRGGMLLVVLLLLLLLLGGGRAGEQASRRGCGVVVVVVSREAMVDV